VLALNQTKIPRHIAIIMDGNGRWAEKKGKNRIEGHREGVRNIERIVKYVSSVGVQYLTLYAFSTENWDRPKQETQALFRIFNEEIKKRTSDFHKQNVRIIHLGRKHKINKPLLKEIENAESLTKKNQGLVLSIAFDYGSRTEIIEAIKKVIDAGVKSNDLDELKFAQFLYTQEIPDPDFLIRTGGEHRLSNFLAWQSIYSEFFFTNVYWPDFRESNMQTAIDEFSRRYRRFGSINN